jgi:hypothetical protein
MRTRILKAAHATPTFDTAQELLQPGETGLFVLTDGRHFTINPEGSGCMGLLILVDGA